MKYRVNRVALIGFGSAVILFVFRITLIATGDNETTFAELSEEQIMINLFLDSLATLFALSIAAIQSIKNYKTNRIAFWLNLIALFCCVLAFWNWPSVPVWQQYGTYFSFSIVLASMCIESKITDQDQTRMDDEDRRMGTRKIAVVLILLMMAMAVITFVKGTPQHTISEGIIYLFVLIIVLLLWDSVESFSLGSIITLKKIVKEKENEVKTLSNENRELRAQFLSFVQNKQILNLEIINGKGPVEASIQDDSPKDELEFDQVDCILEIDSRMKNSEHYQRSMQYLFEKKILSKFAYKNHISLKDIQLNVRFSAKFLESDPIVVRNVMFDAYTKRALDELFIEIKSQYPSAYGPDHLYYLLSQISRYAKNNKANAKMVIVIPKLTEDGMKKILGKNIKDFERNAIAFRQRYAPAIENGLLEIAEIEITDEDLEEMQKECK